MRIYFTSCLACLLLWSNLGFALDKDQKTPVEIENAIKESDFNIVGKVLFLDFWASWCTPCGLSLPWLESLNDKWPGKVQVITINLDKNKDDALRMLKKLSLESLSIVYDPLGKHAENCGLKTMPSSFLFNASHKLVKEYQGFREGDKEKIEHDIEQLLTKEATS